MKQFNLDLSKLLVVDLNKKLTVSNGIRKAVPYSERQIIKSALQLGKPFSPELGGLLEVVEISEHPPSVVVTPSPGAPFISSGVKQMLTVGLGISGWVGFVVGGTAGAGIYGSSTGEFGFYATGGITAGIASGASVGPELDFIFGSPADFAGPFIGFAASVAIWYGGKVGPGGVILFSPGPTTSGGLVSLLFVGFGVRLTAGVSALPFSAQIEWTSTVTKPVIRLR
jgi:hypothetical protein